MSKAAISVASLYKKFRRLPVLQDLSFEVPYGSVFGLIGSNGAGKTTTLKLLMNILQPNGGRAEVLGVDSKRLEASTLARIGYVSENQEMPEWMTVDLLLSYLRPFYPDWDEARAAELIRQFRLPLDRQLRHLSRGMRMKAALASSLAYRPKLLILDEPFTGLDPVVREDLIEGLIESAPETTILISSHDLADIESFATHVGYLDEGRLQFSEEMAVLAQRFREIEVVTGRAVSLPHPDWPSTWLQPEAGAALVRFVDTRFDPDGTLQNIRQLFGDVRDVSVHAMTLRDIFVTLARSHATAA